MKLVHITNIEQITSKKTYQIDFSICERKVGAAVEIEGERI